MNSPLLGALFGTRGNILLYVWYLTRVFVDSRYNVERLYCTAVTLSYIVFHWLLCCIYTEKISPLYRIFSIWHNPGIENYLCFTTVSVTVPNSMIFVLRRLTACFSGPLRRLTAYFSSPLRRLTACFSAPSGLIISSKSADLEVKGGKNEIFTLNIVFRKGIYIIYWKFYQCDRVPLNITSEPSVCGGRQDS